MYAEGCAAEFQTTHWSVVTAIGGDCSSKSAAAWESFATSYWPPLYSFLRRRGESPEDAKDLVQGFFEYLIAKKRLANVVPGRIRFRSFLLTCLKHYTISEYRRDRASTRRPSGGWWHFDTLSAEGDYQAEFADHLTPELVFERAWARRILDQALARLAAYYSEKGIEAEYESLCPHLLRSEEAVPYRDLAKRLQTTEGALKSAMTRLRQRWQACFRSAVAATVPLGHVEEEMRHVVEVLAG